MATITINVDDEVAEKFRLHAYNSFGKTKGSLGKAANEALKNWTEKRNYLDKALKLLNEGRKLGGINYKTRDEIYDRN